jgi:molybdate transport system regulatory protein
MARNAAFRIGSALSIETAQGTLAGQRRMELLTAIGTCRSIAAAARKVGITYKAAWDAVETMNNLAGTPLVKRAVGGRGGGGTSLTERAQELVKAFTSAAQRNREFLHSLNTRAPAPKSDSQLLARLSFATSARNQLAGRVRRIEKGAVNDLVELALPGGEILAAVVTRGSVDSLGLARGMAAVALIKASSIILATTKGRRLSLSARNQLAGRVTRVMRGAVNDEVVVEMKGGTTLAATITSRSARDLKITRGTRVIAIFKSSSVILAVPG